MYDDTSKSQPLRGLAAIGQKPVLTGVWYNKQSVSLDGYRFVGCRFDNCELHIDSSNFDIDRCFIDESSILIYGPKSVKIVKLFTRAYDWFYSNIPHLAPEKHDDGTISILG